ncbi:MAG: hypothetical protein C3F18_05565 [Nitrosomonadales bacterium]|nr:MAG: hypothetical protein C3F18_05565 [Nitrosomonadales bacterium]
MEFMNLTIGRIRLQLPPGLEHRADAIARRLGDELARLSWSGSVSVPQVHLPPQSVQPAWSDRQIARHLAVAVQGQIARQKGESC